MNQALVQLVGTAYGRPGYLSVNPAAAPDVELAAVDRDGSVGPADARKLGVVLVCIQVIETRIADEFASGAAVVRLRIYREGRALADADALLAGQRRPVKQ